MFLTFRQNNSGGFYHGPHFVCVEADSLHEAHTLAQQSGLVYFNGLETGRDCECCGPRWFREWDEDQLVSEPNLEWAAGRPAVILHRTGFQEWIGKNNP